MDQYRKEIASCRKMKITAIKVYQVVNCKCSSGYELSDLMLVVYLIGLVKEVFSQDLLGLLQLISIKQTKVGLNSSSVADLSLDQHRVAPKPSGKLSRLTPSFGCTLAVRPKMVFCYHNCSNVL